MNARTLNSQSKGVIIKWNQNQHFLPTSDREAPTVTCPNDVMQGTDLGKMTTNVTWSDALAVDNSGQVETLTSDYQPGVFGTGVTMVTYTGTDPSGNKANCSFSVIVHGKMKTQLNHKSLSKKKETYTWVEAEMY